MKKLVYIKTGNEIKVNEWTDSLLEENGHIVYIDYDKEYIEIFDGKDFGWCLKEEGLLNNGIKFITV